jgi:hypothetical protein
MAASPETCPKTRHFRPVGRHLGGGRKALAFFCPDGAIKASKKPEKLLNPLKTKGFGDWHNASYVSSIWIENKTCQLSTKQLPLPVPDGENLSPSGTDFLFLRGLVAPGVLSSYATQSWLRNKQRKK